MLRLRVTDNVWPAGRLPRTFAERLAGLFPHVLLIVHPIYRRWQVYETGRRSDWTATRLAQAILAEHAVLPYVDEGADAVYEWQRRRWLTWRGAPLILGDGLPREPGEWLFLWLHEANVPADVFLRLADSHVGLRELKLRAGMHDMHAALASDTYRHWRDYERGDPLAFQRRWVMPVGMDLRT